MRINAGLIFFIIFLEFVNSDIGIGGRIPNTPGLRHQSSDTEKEETLCDNLSNGECPCAARTGGVFCCNIRKENTENCKRAECSVPLQHSSVTISHSNLSFASLNHQDFLLLGLCPDQITEIVIRNSSLDHVIIGGQMTQLKTLDLRQNDVNILSRPASDSIETIYLSESLWPCVDYGRVRDSSLQLGVSMSWLLEPSWSQAWADRDNTFCDSFYRNPQTLEHFLKFTQVGVTEELALLIVLVQKTLSGCPDQCDCEVADEERVVSIDDIELEEEDEELGPGSRLQRTERDGFKVNVFCTDLGLTRLPLSLPPDTVYLNLENNQISSLEPLSHLNPDYKSLERLVLNNNSLASLDGLETSWVHRNGPSLLDIRNNDIRKLDTTALEPMLYKASMKHPLNWGEENLYYMAGNPWSCSCNNIKTIQEFLNKYSNLIEDAGDMRCDECDCDILHLDFKEMCATNNTDSMVWLICLEVTLLVLVLVKLTWDCIRYRRTGHLPWVARHMCWSVPGISRSVRWSPMPRLPPLCPSNVTCDTGDTGGDTGVVSKGSSGYITSSAASSHSGAGQKKSSKSLPGGKESSVVRFL